MPKDELETIEQQLAGERDTDAPPLHLWDPPLSGEIPIRITADGTWYHEGGKIKRDALVRLFASILRREADGEYYLVTPVEKWRIEVELHALIVTDIDRERRGDETWLLATLNTGKKVQVDEDNSLFMEPAVGMAAAMRLPHGLSALFSRSAWYRLVDLADTEEGRSVVRSGNIEFELTPP